MDYIDPSGSSIDLVVDLSQLVDLPLRERSVHWIKVDHGPMFGHNIR